MGDEKIIYEIVAKSEEKYGTPPLSHSGKGFGARHTQAFILFICLSVGFSIKSQLSVSMVAMTSHDFYHNTTCVRNLTDVNNVTEKSFGNCTNNCKNSAKNGTDLSNDMKICAKEKVLSKWNVYRKYDWDKATQEMIMFSFFVGYTSMMLPMGFLAQRYGGKKPIMVALFVNGVLSFITPWVTIFGGWMAICACRLVQGMTQAAFYPAIHTMLGKWAPLSERGRLSTYVYTGSQFGTVFMFQISGLFAGSPSLGWPATFWLGGVLSMACFALLAWLGASSPHDHPNISVEEMTYILEGGSTDVVPKQRRLPWKQILSSTAVWGLIFTHAGSAAGYVLLLTQIPTYMNFVLGVEIKKNGLYSSLPYIAMYFTALLFGQLADYAIRKKILSIANIRRVANTIGMVISGLFLIGFSYVTNTMQAVLMLILTMTFHSAVHVGFHINQIDLAPNFAGPLMAIGNTVANLTSLLVPVIVSNIVRDDMRNQRHWQTVFLIFAGLQFVTNTIFVIFVKGEVQDWNFYGDLDDEKEKEKIITSSVKNNSIKGKNILTKT